MALPVSDYTRAIDALFARTAGHIKPGLSRTNALLLALDNPQNRFPAFHVAGTNGKGSVCATIDALLRCKGYRVGRYTSPHLVDFRERILINSVPIPETHVLDFLASTQQSAEHLEATFFEITTAMAFWYFANQHVDIAVIETGLGGTHDSTNVIDPIVATVTNIGLDHTDYLGPTLQSIANEKAGIFKPGRPAIIGEPTAELAHHLASQAEARGASPIVIMRNSWRTDTPTMSNGSTHFTATTPDGLLELATPLYGQHQAQNTLTAIAAVWTAGAPYRLQPTDLNKALSTVTLPGRFQRTGDWIFDVAHNPAGAQTLAETLQTTPTPRPITALVGVLADKDWRGILDTLAPAIDELIITQPKTAPPDRAWNPAQAAQYATHLHRPVHLETDFDTAMHYAQSRPGTKVITGSFHTVGDAMQHLAINPLIA